jgi:hypothetical protein
MGIHAMSSRLHCEAFNMTLVLQSWDLKPPFAKNTGRQIATFCGYSRSTRFKRGASERTLWESVIDSQIIKSQSQKTNTPIKNQI